jgi:hypothetical protein
MNEELKKTDIWQLYEKGVNYNRKKGLYEDTDKNFRFYNGNQWYGLKSGTIEPIVFNIIQPIVKYKTGTINANLWTPIFSNNNYKDEEFQKVAEETCKLLNKYAEKAWEKDNMDHKIRRVSKQAAINSEGVMYVNFTGEEKTVENEILSKNDVYYGNENSEDIQTQPYIIIKQRKPVSSIITYAKTIEGFDEAQLVNIRGDKSTTEQAGESAKEEVEDMCTLLTKLWKENGEVYYSKSTRNVDIETNVNSGLTLYPVAHFVWESVEGSSRGEGEVKYIIPNQIEINKTAMRRSLSVAQGAYPKPVVNADKIINSNDVDKIGVKLIARGTDVGDVRSLFNYTQPAQMSSDSKQLQDELITNTRELAGAGDIATGNVNPSDASGRAILAVQKASEQPLTEQTTGLKTFIEDLVRIWLDGWIAYSEDTMEFFEEVSEVNPMTQQTETRKVLRKVPKTVLEGLKASVRVDVTPTGAFDRYAVELSLENLFTTGKITFDEYVKALPNGSVMPKSTLEIILSDRKKASKEIAEMQKQAALMQQQFNQTLDMKDDEIDMDALGQPMQPTQQVM